MYKDFYLFIVFPLSPKIILTRSRHSIRKINVINICCMNELHSFCQRWLGISSKFRKHIMVHKFPKGFLFLIFWNSSYSDNSHGITHLMLAFARFTRGHSINVELFLTCVSYQEKCMAISPSPALGFIVEIARPPQPSFTAEGWLSHGPEPRMYSLLGEKNWLGWNALLLNSTSYK